MTPLLRRLALVLAVLAAAVGGPFLARQAAASTSRPLSETSIGAGSDSGPKQVRVHSMNPGKAVVLGVVEGVTEYLPVSSTGHLLVAERALDVGRHADDKEAADAYTVVIQFGAILAVLLIYWGRIVSMAKGLLGRDPQGRALLGRIVVALVPFVLVGITLEDAVKKHLFGLGPVVAAWVVGGLAILWFHRRGLDGPRRGEPLTWLTTRGALVIGVSQVLALWPGTSRSLVTLLAGLAVGLSLPAAVEFTFLLGLATLGGATLYEGAKSGSQVIDAFGWVDPLVGVAVAFAAAVVAVKWMIGYLQRHDLTVFGWYRIGIGVVVAALMIGGVL